MNPDKMTSGYSTIVGQLKRARKQRKRTQKEVAESLGISQPYFSKLETGGQYPSVPLLLRWAREVSLFQIIIN